MRVDKNIPVPKVGRSAVYPFADMSIGDSFPLGDKPLDSCRNAAVSYGHRHSMKFTVRKTDDGSYRCWRVA